MRFSGHDENCGVRVAELPGHPFFLATLFQPELSGGTRPHPVVRALARAAVDHAARRPDVSPPQPTSSDRAGAGG